MKFYLHTLGLCLPIVLLCRCGNPVTPTGGPKDTAGPVLQKVSIDSFENKYSIHLQFDENITTKGLIKTSPIGMVKNEVKRNKLTLEVEKCTKTIQLQSSIVDLNESNPYSGKNISLTKDSGTISIKNLVKNSKITVFIKVDSTIYIPQQIKDDYIFEHLSGREKIITIINKDNNNYIIDPSEEYLEIPILPSFYNTSDTVKINHLVPRVRMYDKKIVLDSIGTVLKTKIIKTYTTGLLNDNTIFQNDTSIESKSKDYVFQEKTIYSIIKDRDTIYLKERHHLTDSIYSINSPITFTQTNKRKNCISLGQLNISQKSEKQTYIMMRSENNTFILTISATKDSVFIPIGKYTCFVSEKPFDTLEPNDTPALLYKFKDDILINSKLENNLILPEKDAYNFGITFK